MRRVINLFTTSAQLYLLDEILSLNMNIPRHLILFFRVETRLHT